MNTWWHTEMMAGYHRQDLLGEVERDRLARKHGSGRMDPQAERRALGTEGERRPSPLWAGILAHRQALRAAMGGIGGLIGLALLYSLY
jgi:hypothetical protein